ncbi:hypothetical protein IFO70_33610 [Phormidium tenue FACHB-886]|nr:hypothetical protein [Phormidium tenue FACHB-886]
MPLFLVSSLYDEGISPNLVRLVEAEPQLAVAQHLLEQPERWDYFLYRAFGRELEGQTLTPAQLLERIEQTQVDGDSSAQLRITELAPQPLAAVSTRPTFRAGALFSDFG